jgi:hypothetical protein
MDMQEHDARERPTGGPDDNSRERKRIYSSAAASADSSLASEGLSAMATVRFLVSTDREKVTNQNLACPKSKALGYP